MKVRTVTPGTALGARLTVLCWGALTMLALVTVSACSGSSSSPPVPSFTATVTTPPTGTHTPTQPASDGATTPASDTTSVPIQTVTPTQTVTPQVTVTVTVPPSSPVPTVAPVTGGGGTAAPQDIVLFGLGAAAILAGAGSLAYRRWLNRGR